MISLVRGTLLSHEITRFAWNSKISTFRTIPRARTVIFKFLMEVKRLLLRLVDSADICILLLSFLHQIISELLCVVLPVPTHPDSVFSITPRQVWNATSLTFYSKYAVFMFSTFGALIKKGDIVMECKCHVIISCYCLFFNFSAHKDLESSCSLQQGAPRILS